MKNPWKDLQKPNYDVSILRVDNHPLDFFWAKDHLDNYLFVYKYPSSSKVILDDVPDLIGIETLHTVVNDGESRLIFTLRDKDDWEIFHDLCLNLMFSTKMIEEVEKAPAHILDRLNSWHNFLKKNKSGLLREEEIKGLIGELLFLKTKVIPQYGISDALRFWNAPEDLPQDFAVNDIAVEVKCQFGGTRPRVKLNSEYQLTTQLSKLILYVVTLGKTTQDAKGAINLPSIISEVESEINSSAPNLSMELHNILIERGYRYSEKYLKFSYVFSDEQAFVVKDDFPRIISEDLTSGVEKVVYNIKLSDCKNFKINVGEWEKSN